MSELREKIDFPRELRCSRDAIKEFQPYIADLLDRAAEEIDRLRNIAAERMDLFKQAANNVESLGAEIARIRAKLAESNAAVSALNGDVHQIGQERDKLREQLGSAREALRARDLRALQLALAETDDLSDRKDTT